MHSVTVISAGDRVAGTPGAIVTCDLHSHLEEDPFFRGEVGENRDRVFFFAIQVHTFPEFSSGHLRPRTLVKNSND